MYLTWTLASGLFVTSAVAIGLAIFMAAKDGLVWLSRRRGLAEARRRFEELVRRAEVEQDLTYSPTVEELYGLPYMDWSALAMLAGLIGLIISTSTFKTIPLAQPSGVAFAAIPAAIRSRLRAQGERRLRRHVHRFVSDLRLWTALTRTPQQALYYLAHDDGTDAPDARGILFTCLKHYVRVGMAPEEALERLSCSDLPDDLREWLERASAAACGNAARGDAPGGTTPVAWLREWTRAESQIHDARARMMLMMAFGLLCPLLGVVLAPALAGLNVMSR